MSARDEILGRIRSGVGKPDYAARRTVAEAYLSSRGRGPQPVLGENLIERFSALATTLSSSIERVSVSADVPVAIARFLSANALGCSLVVSPDLGCLDWADSTLNVASRGVVDADKVGVTGCFCAIAETGTLMLLSGPDTPASVSLLPETHIALIPVSRLVPTMEDAFALLRRECGTLPRAVNFISGPSRTGDIEQTIVLGAHGPCRVHLILVDGE